MPRRDLTLGVDIGTSTAKVVMADVEGAILLQKSFSYRYECSQPGYAEQDPEDWWSAVCGLMKTLCSEHPDLVTRIAAVGVSGQGASVVFLDKEGRPLRRAMLSLDRRCANDARYMQETFGDSILQICGKSPANYNVEPKLRWVQKHEPEVWSSIWKILTPTAFITYKLCGAAVMNHSDAGVLLGYDLNARRWSEDAIAMMGLPSSIYCDLANSDTVVGGITKAASQATGIPQGVPVVAGGEDTSSAGMAMGVLNCQMGQLSLGTSNTVYVPVDFAAIHPRLLAFPHVIANRTLIGGSMSSGGLATQWIRDVLVDGHANSSTLSRLTEEAAELPPGADGLIFLPYLAGELQPINDGFARGVFFGLHAEMGRAHLFRAVLEANALAIEHNLSFARTVGAAPKVLVAVGGPTRNALLCQIIANVTGLTVTVMEESCGAALGSAILGAQGAGLCRLEEMQSAQARPKATYSPDVSLQPTYRRAFKTYSELYPRLKDLYPALSQ